MTLRLGKIAFFAGIMAVATACSPDRQPAADLQAPPATAMNAQALRISLLRNGDLLVDGKLLDVKTLDSQLDASAPTIWYFQENHAPLSAESQARLDDVMARVMKHHKAISISSKPDFTDYVDANGVSRPRAPE